jgi:hypothetical protein
MIVEFLNIQLEFSQILISRTFCSGYFKFKIFNLPVLRFIHFTIDPLIISSSVHDDESFRGGFKAI